MGSRFWVRKERFPSGSATQLKILPPFFLLLLLFPYFSSRSLKDVATWMMNVEILNTMLATGRDQRYNNSSPFFLWFRLKDRRPEMSYLTVNWQRNVNAMWCGFLSGNACFVNIGWIEAIEIFITFGFATAQKYRSEKWMDNFCVDCWLQM